MAEGTTMSGKSDVATQGTTGGGRGSLRAVLAFSLGCTFFAYAFVQRVAPSVMVDELMRDFAVGGAVLGNLSAFYFYAYAGIQIPVGIMMDRFGPRRLLTFTLLLCVVGSALFAYSDSLASASVARAIIGGSVAFGFVGTMTIAAQQFSPQRFALCVGILQGIGMVGAVLGQAPYRVLLDVTGWREALLWTGGVAAVLALAIWITVRDGERHTGGGTRLLDGIRFALKNRQTWLNSVVGLSLTAPMLAFAGLWAVPYLTTIYEIPKREAGALASMLFIGWGVASPFIGGLSDRIGQRKPLIIAGVLMSMTGLAIVGLVPGLPVPLLYVIFFVTGAGGCTMILTFALCRETTPLWARGAALGVVNGAVTGSGALFQPMLGWILDTHWQGVEVAGARIYTGDGYQAAILALVATNVVGLVAALCLRETRGQQLA
jgi:MFS family permease